MGKKFLKKILLSLISIAVCCPILSSFVFSDYMGMGLLVKDGVVVKYTGESSELVIPDYLGIIGIGEKSAWARVRPLLPKTGVLGACRPQ